MHYEGNLDAFKVIAELKGYEVVTATDQKEVERILIEGDIIRVLQDANLGDYGAINIEPAERSYEILKEKIKKGLVKFLAITGRPETVDLLHEKGIPGEDKSDFAPKAIKFFD